MKMSDIECTVERFLQEVTDHEMTVRINDGVNRHLIFKNPETRNCWFGLTTWDNFSWRE